MRSRRKLVNQINVVPFIDVMLVLLIVFMVAAPLIRQGEVKLPSVGQNLSSTQQSAIEVILKADKSLALRDTPGADAKTGLTRPQLIAAIKATLVKNPEASVVIAADKSVRYEEVVTLLSLLNENNVRKVGLLAEISK